MYPNISFQDIATLSPHRQPSYCALMTWFRVYGGISTRSSSWPIRSCMCILLASLCLSLLSNSRASVWRSSCAAWDDGSSSGSLAPACCPSAARLQPLTGFSVSSFARYTWGKGGIEGNGERRSSDPSRDFTCPTLSTAASVPLLCPFWDVWKEGFRKHITS